MAEKTSTVKTGPSSKDTVKAPSSAEVKQVYSLDDIKYNEENKVMAILSTLGIIGLIIAFVEKDDAFVRYHGFQFGFASLLLFIFIIPYIGWCIGPIYAIVYFVFWIMGLMKILNGERYDMPVVSDLALKMLNK